MRMAQGLIEPRRGNEFLSCEMAPHEQQNELVAEPTRAAMPFNAIHVPNKRAVVTENLIGLLFGSRVQIDRGASRLW